MKKNITINLCGRLYAIDEDAYELLNHYTDTLRNYFRKQEEGGDEIANDIEERIAELFDEIKAQGTEAITIEHVQDIISRIGQLEDIAPGEEGAAKGQKKTTWASESIDESVNNWANGLKSKKFYRDPKDKVLSGVLSGCANYFGGNATLWRIGYILLALWGGVIFTFIAGFIGMPFLGPVMPIIIYVIAAVILPAAETPEDRLKMKGKEVNPQNLSNEVSESAMEDTAGKSNNKGCLAQFFTVIGKMFLGIGMILGILISIPCLVFTCLLVASLFAPKEMVENIWGSDVNQLYMQEPAVFWIFGICVVIASFIPAYCSFHCLLSWLKKVPSMSMAQRISWVLIWIVAVAGIVATGTKIDNTQREVRHANWDKEVAAREKWDAEHTFEGFTFSREEDYEFFKNGRWQLLKAENCSDDRYTYSGQYYTGDKNVRYLDAYNNEDYYEDHPDIYSPLVYHAERTDTVAPGIYRLTALARCAEGGNGVCIFAFTENKDNYDINLSLTPVPARGDGGVQEKNDSLYNASQGKQIDLKGVRSKLSYGWSVVTVDSIVVPEDGNHKIRYGVSTDAPFTGMKCTAKWFSATDFKLEYIGKLEQ